MRKRSVQKPAKHVPLPTPENRARIPWTSSDPRKIHAHCRWEVLKGEYEVKRRDAADAKELYLRAKNNFDQDAAAELVEYHLNGDSIDKLVDDVLRVNLPVRVVYPNPEFNPDTAPVELHRPKNAIPYALAAEIATQLGGEIENGIVQIARAGRTKLKKFPRFLWQPCFKGEIKQGVSYVIVDDVCTLGGTLASLRSCIVSGGGTVAAATVLANSDGNATDFPIAKSTVDVLRSLYGPEIDDLWREEIGHDIPCLTEAEGSFLVSWGTQERKREPGISLSERLRGRLSKARATAK